METLQPQPGEKKGSPMATVSVRYIVNDIDAAIDFYTTHLEFELQMRPNDLFAMLGRGDLRGSRPCCRCRGTAKQRCPVPQQHSQRNRRQADHHRGPLRQPRRALRADPPRGQAFLLTCLASSSYLSAIRRRSTVAIVTCLGESWPRHARRSFGRKETFLSRTDQVLPSVTVFSWSPGRGPAFQQAVIRHNQPGAGKVQ